MNQATLLGRIGRDAETKTFDSGSSVTEFSLATDDGYKKDGEKVERTNWHRIKIFDKRGEALSPYLTKGKLVMLTGRIEYREYEKDGEKRHMTEVVIDRGGHFEFCGGRSDDTKSDEPKPKAKPKPKPNVNPDDIPF